MPPTCSARAPTTSSSGRAASTSPSSPPTTIVSEPALAPRTPPDTGASTKWTPRSAIVAEMSLVSVGAELLMSSRSVPGVIASSSPSSRSTERTIFEFGSMRTTPSAPCATSVTAPTTVAPLFPTASRACSETSKPRTEYPAAMRLSTIGPPMLPRPTKPIVVPGLRTGGSALVGEVIEHLLRDAEGLQAGRHAAVHGGLQQHLLDLLLRGAVVDRPADVRAELGRAVQRGEHGEVDEAAGLALEARAVPDRAPAELRDELLHRLAELGAALQRAIDVGVAEDRPADRHALVVEVAHAPTPFASSASETSSSQFVVPIDVAVWSRNESGEPPCQCSSPAGIQAMSPARIASTLPSRARTTPAPAMTGRTGPPSCVCQ